MLTKEIQEKFPFLSIVLYGGSEYIGVIINQDQSVTSMYVYTLIRSEKEKLNFLDLGDVWWWESNRLLPINIFLRSEMIPYQYAIITMVTKDVNVLIGPCVNLNNLASKRVKRKNIQLIRRSK